MIADNFRKILSVRIGSYCHGTNIETSDQDIRHIVIPTYDYFLGLKEYSESKAPEGDIEYWNVKKLVALCAKGNPSALNILFVHNKDILFVDEYGQKLIDFRDNFLSKNTITQIVGYATSQIHKLVIGRGTKEGKRMKMIEEYGYDTKFAMHSVMLTNMAIDLIKNNKYSPLRTPSEQSYLKQIRRGQVGVDSVLNQIQSNLMTIKTIEPISNLKDKPDHDVINMFLANFLWDYFES